jgi:hypothetical protein
MRILILFCLIPFFNSFACNGLEQRSLDLLNNGTEEQQSLFEKIQTGDPLTEEEAELYDQAQIETLKKMQTELHQALDELPTPETLATSYSGSCSDSTLALSEMTQTSKNANQALQQVTKSYPYELRGLNPVERGEYHPLVTWLAEDGTEQARYTYRLNGQFLSDETRTIIQEKGGEHWLKTISSTKMKAELTRILPKETVELFDYGIHPPSDFMKSMSVGEEGEIAYKTRIITSKMTPTGPQQIEAKIKIAHSTYITRISNKRVVLIDQNFEQVLVLDLTKETNELEKEINRFAYRGSRESFNHEIRLYRNAANEAEKQIAANEVIQSLGYLPEDTETFFSIKDTFWMSQTKISNG